jgi:hypothetical protein
MNIRLSSETGPRLVRRNRWPGSPHHGPVGSGKSDLTLRLLDRGFALVSDDQTLVKKTGTRLTASGTADDPRQAGDSRHRDRGDGAVDDQPVALVVELTSDIPTPSRRQSRAPDHGRLAATDQRRRHVCVGRFKVAWRLIGLG